MLCWVNVDARNDQPLSFSNTQGGIAHRFRPYLNEKPYFLSGEWKREISLPNFPKNSSKETKRELRDLLNLQEQRTKHILDTIRKERAVLSFGVFDGFPIREISFSEENPLNDLFQLCIRDVFIALFYFKKRFDRVRPEFLESRLRPTILTPLHPAYPSGHATEAYFIALFLSYFEPSRREAFIKDAVRIAKNREYAGVHYSSDSEAGFRLAEQVFLLFKKSQSFKERMNLAKQYWKMKKVGHLNGIFR